MDHLMSRVKINFLSIIGFYFEKNFFFFFFIFYFFFLEEKKNGIFWIRDGSTIGIKFTSSTYGGRVLCGDSGARRYVSCGHGPYPNAVTEQRSSAHVVRGVAVVCAARRARFLPWVQDHGAGRRARARRVVFGVRVLQGALWCAHRSRDTRRTARGGRCGDADPRRHLHTARQHQTEFAGVARTC